VVGTAALSRPDDPRLADLRAARATLTVRVVAGAGRRILAERTGQGAAVDADAADAAREAVGDAAEAAADGLSKDLEEGSWTLSRPD
ncbi:MAG: hypothetical protein KGM24_09165, partial [Elusimicrobia bacterium]|nr:hypothetical protein [Elusimicrobiota bacterium]